ncbi:MAG: hypothetical protein AAF633_10640 [Chloroflexota bacterium]
MHSHHFFLILILLFSTACTTVIVIPTLEPIPSAVPDPASTATSTPLPTSTYTPEPTATITPTEVVAAGRPAEIDSWTVSIVQDGTRYSGQEVTLNNRPFEIEVEMGAPHSIIWSAEPNGDSWYINEVGISITETVSIIQFNTLWSLNTMDIDPKEMPHLCRCLPMYDQVTYLQEGEDWYSIEPIPDSERFKFKLPIEQINGRPLEALDGLTLFLQFFIDNGDKIIDEGELHKIALTIDNPEAEPEVEALAWRDGTTSRLLEDGLVEIVRDGGEPERFDTPISINNEPGWAVFPHELRVLNMDEDDELEVAAIISSPGASCCTTLTVFDYDPKAATYRASQTLERKYTLGFRFGRKESPAFGPFYVWTLNESFNYRLDGASVVSFASPLQILRLDAGRLVDVTTEFPHELERHLPTFFIEDELDCVPFAVGSYLAEMGMLGRYEEGLTEARSSCDQWLTEEDWSNIDATLLEFGYLKKVE